MSKFTKVNVEVGVRDLVQEIASAEQRTMSGQIKHWAKKDAKRLKIGSMIMPKPHVPKPASFEDGDNVNTNKK